MIHLASVVCPLKATVTAFMRNYRVLGVDRPLRIQHVFIQLEFTEPASSSSLWWGPSWNALLLRNHEICNQQRIDTHVLSRQCIDCCPLELDFTLVVLVFGGGALHPARNKEQQPPTHLLTQVVSFPHHAGVLLRKLLATLSLFCGQWLAAQTQ